VRFEGTSFALHGAAQKVWTKVTGGTVTTGKATVMTQESMKTPVPLPSQFPNETRRQGRFPIDEDPDANDEGPEVQDQESRAWLDDARDVDMRPSYLPASSSERAGERWRQIQGKFVDDPRNSVTEAHELVGELMQKIIDGFTRERATLEGQWSNGADVSTEDLRVCLKRYRDFFNRLLPAIDRTDGT
jgi:hypothetical protein